MEGVVKNEEEGVNGSTGVWMRRFWE